MAQTEKELCAEFDAFLEKTGLPEWSADELWHELSDRIQKAEAETEALRAQREWVWRFWMRWEEMTDAERMERTK